ncbi:MAG: T9SS type A sorting domain-containing protein [Flavobacteriales bacterium]
MKNDAAVTVTQGKSSRPTDRALEIAIVPNPATDHLFFVGAYAVGIVRAEVFAAYGLELLSWTTLIQEGVDVSGIGSGSYAVVLTLGSGDRSMLRFVKR